MFYYLKFDKLNSCKQEQKKKSWFSVKSGKRDLKQMGERESSVLQRDKTLSYSELVSNWIKGTCPEIFWQWQMSQGHYSNQYIIQSENLFVSHNYDLFLVVT